MIMKAGGKRIYVVAADPSADALGSDLIHDLRIQASALVVAGAGGKTMAAIGVESHVDISPMQTFGYAAALKAWPKVGGIIHQLLDEIAEFQPDAVVMIDNWSFTHRLAKVIRRKLPDCKLVKYVAPQVFVSRKARAREAADTYDLLLALHEFELPNFTRYGLPCIAVGNPALSQAVTGDGAAFRKRYGLKDAPVLCVLFGSRVSEFNHLRGVFLSAVSDLRALVPGLQVISPLSENIATLVRVEAARDPRLMDIVLVDEGEKADAIAACTAALACSGTVTLQVAQAGKPMLVAYKSDWLTAKIMMDLYKVKFANLLNWSAGEHIVPEYLQEQCTAERLVQDMLPLLSDENAREKQISRVAHEVERMHGPGNKKPSAIAAEGILRLLD